MDVWLGNWVSGRVVEWVGRGQEVVGVHINKHMVGDVLTQPCSPFRVFPFVVFNTLVKQTGWWQDPPGVFLGTPPPCAWHLTPHLFRTVGRKQFMRFEWASHAAEALGCDYEELNTATFKHHLRQIIEQMTSGPQRQSLEDNDTCSGTKPSRPHAGWVPGSSQQPHWWLPYTLSRVHQDV